MAVIADRAAGAHNRGADRAVGPHARAVEQHRALDVSPLPHGDISTQDRPPAHDGAIGDQTARPEHGRRGDPALDRRGIGQDQAGICQLAAKVGADVPLEDVVGALQVALGRPNVQPVTAGLVSEQSIANQGREHVALHRDVRSLRGDRREELAFDHVRSGVDQIRVDLLGAGLLDEFAD